MTGRTNVGGGGTALNADVEPKIVKSGSITAGDFVEYYAEQTEIPFTTDIYYKGIIGNYIIAIIQSGSTVGLGNITLIKNETIISTYSDYVANNVIIVGDYIVFSSTSQNIGVLKIQNDVLTVVDIYSCSDYVNGLWYANNKLLALMGYQKLLVCTLDANGMIQTHVESAITGLSNNSNPDIRFYDGWYYFVCKSYYCYKCQLNQNDEVINMTQIYSSISYSYFMYQKGSKVLYLYRSSGSTPSTKLLWVELTTGTVTQITGLNGIIVTPLDENNNFVSIAGSVYLYYFNDVAAQITLQAQTAQSLGSLNNAMYKTLLFTPQQQIYTPRYAYDDENMILDISGALITKKQNKNYVRPYRDGYKPIGVAKDSGNINDIIDVYVPTPIS